MSATGQITKTTPAAPSMSAVRPGPDPSSPIALREAIVAFSGFMALAVIAYASHMLHGGFVSDDWSDAAGALHPPGGPGLAAAMSYFNGMLSSCRPVLIVLIPLKYLIFGTHMRMLLSLAVFLAVLVALLLYIVLRMLTVPWHHAFLITALTLIYPWFDSTRFWESASLASIAIIFALAGLCVALIGLSRCSWRFHGIALALYLLSVLTYEATLPVIACAGFIYLVRAGWGEARWRWALDLLVLIAGGSWDYIHTPRIASTGSGVLTHFKSIITAGGELLGRTLIPLGAQPRAVLALGAIALIGSISLIVWLLHPKRDHQAGWGLREWLILGISGLAVAVLGWMMFIPADPYYTPTIYGVSNRVNAVSGFGLLIVVYSSLGMVGSLVAGVIGGRRSVATTITVAAAVLFGAANMHVLERHSALWNDAFQHEAAVIGRLETEFPHLPHGTTIFAANFPANQSLGVPIFASTWDLTGMVRLRYEDPTLRAYPITAELQLVCQRRGITIKTPQGGPIVATARYGTAWLLDVEDGGRFMPPNQSRCRQATANYPPGPFYLSTSY